MMKVTQLILLLITIAIANNHRSHLAKILKTQKSFFKKTNENLHNILNKILESLNVDTNFTAPSEIKLLLTMHYGLNNIAEKTCEIYDEVRNTIRLTDNKTENKLFTLNVLNEILNEKSFKIKIIERMYQITEDKIEARDIKSDEITELTDDYLMMLKILNINDLIDKPDAESSDDDDDMSAPKVELKVWDTSSTENSSGTRRVYKGLDTNVETYPFIVSIHVMGEFTCAGSIISTNLVITAASCLQIAYNNTYFKQNTESIVIRVGSDYMSRGGKVLPVLEIFFHPSYDPMNLWNNLAIMRVQSWLKLSKKDEKIRRIMVNKNADIQPYKINEVMVLGWGARDESQIVDPFKKIAVAKLNVFRIDECKKTYTSHYVNDKHFCAGYFTKGGGACNRDIGGPGLINKFLSGVVSFGSPTCGALNSPTVFMNLGHYAGWIEQILRLDLISDKRSIAPTTVITESENHFALSLSKLNRKTTPHSEDTTETNVTSNEMTIDLIVNNTTDKNNQTNVEDNQTEGTDTISGSYEDQSNSSNASSGAPDTAFKATDTESGSNDIDEGVDGATTEANISEMNEKYGNPDDKVLIWNIEPKEVQIRKIFKN